MSLTSYRAAPSRDKGGALQGRVCGCSYVFGRPGDDLLSRALRRSTIGSGGLNDRVRNGIGWGISDKVTGSTKHIRGEEIAFYIGIVELWVLLRNDQADRIISTSKLHTSPRFHTWPINVVVFHDPQRSLVLRLVSRLDAFSGYLFHT